MNECPGCLRRFLPKHKKHRYCSRSCQSRVSQRARLGIEDPGHRRRCWWCRSVFLLLDARRDFCSSECARISGLLSEVQRKYGITKDQYRSSYFAQGGKCAICRLPERTERNTLLAVDHDHVTGQFRGLLCSQCNRAIGLLQDDPEVLISALTYLGCQIKGPITWWPDKEQSA